MKQINYLISIRRLLLFVFESQLYIATLMQTFRFENVTLLMSSDMRAKINIV